ncbi:hypothetical protein CF327_g5531 [Tilletia walkeri]|nr:hypothetical protein CF327_g5531 [Tilletia walkeri]
MLQSAIKLVDSDARLTADQDTETTRGPHWLLLALLTPQEGHLGGIHAPFETSVPMQGDNLAVRTPSINGRPYDRSLPVPGYSKPIEESAVKNPNLSEPGVTAL